MNSKPVLRATIAAASVALLAAPDARALDLGKANPLNWFDKKDETVPSAPERQVQEGAAEAMLRDAKTAASTGNTGRATSIYKDVVSRYRFTNAAANAQFELAVLQRRSGKLQDSYDSFQKFITDYRQSARFDEAVQQQFEIAEEAKAGKKEPRLLMIPMKMDKSDLVKLYQGVIRNSPYGKYAPYAQFAIGEVYQDDGDKPMANQAYQMVVDNYPNTKLASEAQFRIGAISSAAARNSQDASNLGTALDAMETYKALNPAGERVQEADSLISEGRAAQSANALSIAKFYEKAGKPKAAAIYYSEAMQTGGGETVAEAQRRLAALAASNPEDVKQSGVSSGEGYVVPAVVNTKNRDEYAGPPAPVVAKLNSKPSMRVEPDNFKPIPLTEPDLPTREGQAPTAPGTLLPPAEGDKPLLLPVPPSPGAPMPAPQSLPVPPAPAAGPAPVPPAPGPDSSKPADEQKPADAPKPAEEPKPAAAPTTPAPEAPKP
jgi:outer membrane protein assembly factor BamD (BamD/ComL family)